MSIQTTSTPSERRNCIHRAGWVVKDPGTIIRNGYVLVESGKIRETGEYGKKAPSPGNIPIYDHGPGALVPALVNAHTHLELSCFKDRISCAKGFGSWVHALLKLRENSTPDEMITGAARGLSQILSSGTGTLCEISSLGLTLELVSNSGIQGLWCREVLGNLTPAVDTRPAKRPGRIRAALAGHAPHTTAPTLLRHLKQVSSKRNLPFSIHVSESAEEMEFIGSGRGKWADFLTSREIDFSNWPLPARSPVVYLDSLGILDAHSLVVHMLRASDADLGILKQCHASVCVCPRSNQILHDRLPDIPAMLARGIRLCLGTDSLASTPSLDLFDEMAFIAAHYQSIEPQQILAMATTNGASALHQSVVGTFDRGFKPYMVYVPVACTLERHLIETIVNKGFSEPCKPLFPGART
jgi:aminodeoxyfutalosine deaminase